VPLYKSLVRSRLGYCVYKHDDLI